MPLYEYKCLNCEKTHEIMQKFSDAPLETCPSCEGKLTKLMSLSSFALKGTGWYTTDYKRTSSSKGASSSEKPVENSGSTTPSSPVSTTTSTGDKGTS